MSTFGARVRISRRCAAPSFELLAEAVKGADADSCLIARSFGVRGCGAGAANTARALRDPGRELPLVLMLILIGALFWPTKSDDTVDVAARSHGLRLENAYPRATKAASTGASCVAASKLGTSFSLCHANGAHKREFGERAINFKNDFALLERGNGALSFLFRSIVRLR